MLWTGRWWMVDSLVVSSSSSRHEDLGRFLIISRDSKVGCGCPRAVCVVYAPLRLLLLQQSINLVLLCSSNSHKFDSLSSQGHFDPTTVPLCRLLNRGQRQCYYISVRSNCHNLTQRVCWILSPTFLSTDARHSSTLKR